MNVFEEIRSLGFPQEKLIVLGGASIAAHGLREAADIDIFVTPDLFEHCKNSGEWQVLEWDHSGRQGDLWLKNGKIELYEKFWYDGKYYSFEELLPYTTLMHGLHIAPIYWLMNWKKSTGRPKDIADVALIKEYLEVHPELVIEPK